MNIEHQTPNFELRKGNSGTPNVGHFNAERAGLRPEASTRQGVRNSEQGNRRPWSPSGRRWSCLVVASGEEKIPSMPKVGDGGGLGGYLCSAFLLLEAGNGCRRSKRESIMEVLCNRETVNEVARQSIALERAEAKRSRSKGLEFFKWGRFHRGIHRTDQFIPARPPHQIQLHPFPTEALIGTPAQDQLEQRGRQSPPDTVGG